MKKSMLIALSVMMTASMGFAATGTEREAAKPGAARAEGREQVRTTGREGTKVDESRDAATDMTRSEGAKLDAKVRAENRSESEKAPTAPRATTAPSDFQKFKADVTAVVDSEKEPSRKGQLRELVNIILGGKRGQMTAEDYAHVLALVEEFKNDPKADLKQAVDNVTEAFQKVKNKEAANFREAIVKVLTGKRKANNEIITEQEAEDIERNCM